MKKTLSHTLIVCLLLSYFAFSALAEESMPIETLDSIPPLEDDIFLFVDGDLAFSFCDVPYVYELPENPYFSKMTLYSLVYEDGSQWCLGVGDAAPFIEEGRKQVPDMEEFDLQLNAMDLLISLLISPSGTFDSEPACFVRVDRPDGRECPVIVGNYHANGEDELPAGQYGVLCTMDGSRILCLTGSLDENLAAMMSSIGYPTEKVHARYEARLQPRDVNLFTLQARFPAAYKVEYPDPVTRLYSCMTADHTPITVSFVLGNTSPAPEGTAIEQQLDLADQQFHLIAENFKKQLPNCTAEVTAPFDGVVLMTVTIPSDEEGYRDQVEAFYYTPECLVEIQTDDTPTGWEFIRSVCSREVTEEPAYAPDLSNVAMIPYDNRYLGYRLSVPDFFTAWTEELNSLMIEEISKEQETKLESDAVYENRSWFVWTGSGTQLNFAVQLKECSYADLEEEFKNKPLEAQNRSKEFPGSTCTALFDARMLDTPSGKMILCGYETQYNGKTHKDVYCDYYANTIEYCFILDGQNVETEFLVELMTKIAETIEVDQIL